ncbi:hypothetical protein OCU89_11280, partial [Escherichia coli]|nr:hypothetical protein [Escherichia coli]
TERESCVYLRWQTPVGRIRRSRRIRHEIRRTGSTHMPDAQAYRAYREGKLRLFALADTCRPDKALAPHPA